MNLRIDRSSKNLKIILSIVFSVVLLTGATLIWKSLGVLRQKAKMPVEMNNDETAGWKVYKNDKYAFEIKYPPFLKMIAKGSNAAQYSFSEKNILSITPSKQTSIFVVLLFSLVSVISLSSPVSLGDSFVLFLVLFI